MADEIRASIIIRCKDEERAIGRVLESVFSQDTGSPFEVILVDSGSTDRTLDIAAGYDCRILEIPPEEFGYGYTMNLGAEAANGEFLVYISAHCPPVGRDWLEELLAPFSDPVVAGTFGAQVPEKGINPFEEWRLYRAFPQVEGPHPQEHMFSSANGAVREKVWREIRFDEELPFSEDRGWARTAAAKGMKVRYVPSAAVYHSHPFSMSGVRNRAYAAGWAKKKIYGRDCRFDSIIWIISAFAYCIFRDAVHFAANGYWGWFPRIPAYRYEELAGFYSGASDCAKGLRK